MSSTVTIQAALARITKIRDVGVVSINLEDIAQNRLDLIIRHGLTVKAADLEKYSRVRCLATLVVVIQFLERSATDDALTIFDAVMQQTGVRSQNRHRKERLRSLKDLDAAALTLRDVARLVLDSSVAETELRKRIFEQFGEARLLEAISQISEKASSVEDEETRIWENAHQSISGFIIGLLETIHFEAVPAAKSLLIAMNFVKKTSKTATSTWGDPPRGFIPKTWLRLIFPFGEKGKTIFKRQHYVVCVAHQLYLALKRGDVFVPRSNHHHDPRAAMLQREEWKAVKDDVLAQLGLHEKSEVMLKTWSKLLDDKFRSVNPLLEDNPKVRLTKDETAPNLIITPFDALPESPSLIALNRAVEARLPNIALPELLLEIDARLGFTQDMLQTATGHALGKDTKLSLIAVLVAQACNIGLSAVCDESNPALKLERLSRVKKYYLNPATISQANALLVEYHSKLAMTKRWGDGEIASADGLRFVVPVKTIHAGANPKYFGVQRGITYYTLVSDQFTQLHGQVIPGTIKDSLYILSALLEQQTVLRPQKIISDTGAYSDVIFGLFFLLGYQFSPRLKDAGGARYWRINRQADYGKLNKVARYSINTRLIHQHWEDILRLLGSLKLGKIKAVDALRVLARDSTLGGLGRAVQEIGRIAKTLFLLGYVTDENIQRGVHLILTHGETRHSLARATYHGNQGEVRQHYQVGMESQLGALGFVVNVIVLWNTLYTQAALEIIAAMGDDVFEEDVMRLSPLKWKHINMLGYYDFTVSPEVEAGDLRPLRDPNMLTEQELLELIESE
jgi:TnpA family transposase